MGFVAPFIPMIISSLVGAGVGKLTSRSPDAPKSLPSVPTPPPTASDDLKAAAPTAATAAMRVRRSAIAGRAQSILSAAPGLGSLSGDGVQHATVLGY